MNSLDQFLWVFRQIEFGLGAALCLLIIAGISVRKMYAEYKAVIQDVDNANNALGEYEDGVAFSRQFHIANSKLKEINRIQRSWEEYSKTLLPPLDNIDEPEYQVYRSTKRAADYFDADHISSKIKPVVESENLIGIGLVLTFFGLVAALIHAGLSIQDTANTQGIVIAIKALLATAGAKFFASIGGVMGSLIQSIAMNQLRGKVDEKLKIFNDRLESLLTFASLERIAADQYAHAKRQTARLEDMSTEITMAIGQNIENALNQMPNLMGTAVTNAIQPLTDRIANMADNVGNQNADALQNMVNQFRDQLQGAGEQTMNQVVAQLDSLSTTLNQTIGTLAQSNNEIRISLQEVMGNLTATSHNFDNSVQASANAAADGIRSVLNELQQQQVASTTAMNALVARLDQAANQAGEGIARGINGAVGEILDQARNTSNEVSQTLSEGLSEVTASLARINVEVERHRSGLEQINSQIQNTSSALGGAAETIRTTVQPLSQVCIQLSEAVNTISRSVMTTGETTQRIVQLINELKQTWEQQAGQLAQADASLEAAFNSITQNLTQSLSMLEQFTTGIEDRLGAALSNLSAIVQELSDSLEDNRRPN